MYITCVVVVWINSNDPPSNSEDKNLGWKNAAWLITMWIQPSRLLCPVSQSATGKHNEGLAWGSRAGWLHPWKLTWNIWNTIVKVWKMIFLCKLVIFRFHPLIFRIGYGVRICDGIGLNLLFWWKLGVFATGKRLDFYTKTARCSTLLWI